MTRVKICGLSRKFDIDYVNSAMPEYIGFVFAESKRQVTLDTARMLKERLDKRIKAVGVFVNDSVGRIAKACDESIIDIIQLHGDEDETYIGALRELTGKPIIRAVRVRDKGDVLAARDCGSDYVLFDAYRPQSYGGTGQAFDWDFIKDFDRPFFLGGGIHVENISSAITRCTPFCVDVSSGVETYGVKDISKINDVIRLARRKF